MILFVERSASRGGDQALRVVVAGVNQTEGKVKSLACLVTKIIGPPARLSRIRVGHKSIMTEATNITWGIRPVAFLFPAGFQNLQLKPPRVIK